MNAAALSSGILMQGLQVYNPGEPQTDSAPQTYSAPQADSAPRAPMNGMLMTLQITVESASNLYNADGVLAGKSDPYVIVEVPGQESIKLQTEIIMNDLNPVWNFVGHIAGFTEGDVLRFTVMDKDTYPKPDDFLGKAELAAQDLYPNGFSGELTLADSKTQATLSVKVDVIDCNMAYGELVPMDDTVTTGAVESQPMIDGAPQAPAANKPAAAAGRVVVYPPVTISAEEFAKLSGTIMTEPLPVTEGAEAPGMEALGVGTKREVDVNDTEAADKTVKIKKKKSKKCC